jgi:hypothetical protein
MDAFKSNKPVLLFIFYQEWLLPRRKEWGPLSSAAGDAGFLVIVAEWEKLIPESGGVKADEALVYQPESGEFELREDFVFTPAVVMTTWGNSGYSELFRDIISQGAYNSEYALIAKLDGKCELERCLRDYELSTGYSVSRPKTFLSEELFEDNISRIDKEFVIVKPSHSGQCKGIEIVPRDSLIALAKEVSEGNRPPFVAQELIEDFFLYKNRRWDIRVNVLATSLIPLQYHLFPQGVAKTTGMAVNPGSIALEEWLNAESFLEGKHHAENLSMTEMLDYIALEYRPLQDFWSQIDEVIGHVFSAIALQAKKENLPIIRSFMYPGFDFIVQRDKTTGYKVKLLEINSHPGLGWEPHIMNALAPQFRFWFSELQKLVRIS